MTYTDLTPICQVTPAVSSGDINAQANSILKVLSGEDAEFDISSGGLTFPIYGNTVYQTAIRSQTIYSKSWTSAAILSGLTLTQPSVNDSRWTTNPNVTYTYIEPNVIPTYLLCHYFRVSNGVNYADDHPVLAFNTNTKQFELRIGTVSSNNTITYSAWDSNASWEMKNQVSAVEINQVICENPANNQKLTITPTSIEASSTSTTFYIPTVSMTAADFLSNSKYGTMSRNLSISTGVTEISANAVTKTYYAML